MIRKDHMQSGKPLKEFLKVCAHDLDVPEAVVIPQAYPLGQLDHCTPSCPENDDTMHFWQELTLDKMEFSFFIR